VRERKRVITNDSLEFIFSLLLYRLSRYNIHTSRIEKKVEGKREIEGTAWYKIRRPAGGSLRNQPMAWIGQ
jgi:hypothetical protein